MDSLGHHLFIFCFKLPAQMSRNEHISLQFYCYLEWIAKQCAHLIRQVETKCKQMMSSRINLYGTRFYQNYRIFFEEQRIYNLKKFKSEAKPILGHPIFYLCSRALFSKTKSSACIENS